jgi:two-component system, sensor histidine kinase and response regulator
MSPSLEVFFANAADAIIIAEKTSGIILDANKAASQLLQLPHEKIVGMHQSKLHPQNDSSSFKKHKKELDKTDLTVPHESKILCSDGSEIPVEILASKIDYEGKQCIMGIFRDISIRKQTEQDLIQSEEKFRNLLELAPEAFYHGDSEGNIIAVNKKAIELTEYTREELISMPISKLFSPDTLNENPLRYDLLQRGETITRERRIITKTGNAVSVEMKSKMMPDGRLQCFMSDISKRKKAEQALIQSEDRLKSIVNESPFPIAIANDSNEKILYWSRSAKKMFGHSAEYVTEWYKLAYPDADYRKKVIKRWESYFSEAQETGKAINTGEYKITCKNGSVKICELYIQYINNDVIVSFNDITERLKSEKAIKKSEEKSRLLIKNSNDIIVLVNEKGEQTFISDVVENITGYTSEELYGNILDVIHPDDVELVSQHWTEVLSNPKKPARVQYRHKHKIKGYVWLEAVAQNFLDNPFIKSVVANIRDITNNKESETKLKELNATKDKLFSIIAHDLRSPLNNILGFSDLMIEKLQTSDIEKAKKYADVINSSTKNYLNLVDNLLTWAKTQTEEIKYTCKNLDLKPIVEESLMVLYPAASLKKIELIISVSDDIVACADQNMLQTIIRNLVQNAIKFTCSGGKVDINAVSNQNHIEISVTDNGIGINEENQKKLFGADLNFSMNGTENEGGTGLGLILYKEFVEKHCGKIWVESQAGTGSKFVFTLPKSTKKQQARPRQME